MRESRAEYGCNERGTRERRLGEKGEVLEGRCGKGDEAGDGEAFDLSQPYWWRSLIWDV